MQPRTRSSWNSAGRISVAWTPTPISATSSSTTRPKDAIRHYEVGFRIGELALGPNFDGLLPWGHIDNRPFLRCMHGFGLCLWRLGRFEEAGRIFDRMLWLNPSDNQGVRFLIDGRAGKEGLGRPMSWLASSSRRTNTIVPPSGRGPRRQHETVSR